MEKTEAQAIDDPVTAAKTAFAATVACQSPLHPAETRIHDLVDIRAESGLADDQSYEGKKRNGCKGIFQHGVADGDLQEVHRKGEIVPHHPDRDEADDAQGNPNVEPQVDQDDDGRDRSEADFNRLIPRLPDPLCG